MNKFFSICLFTLTMILTNKAQAQVLGTSAPTSAMTVSIAQVRDLAVSSGSSTAFDFSSIATLDNGIETLNAVGLTYKANKLWVLSIKANTANFGGASITPMPASVVTYKVNGSVVAYTPLTASDAVVGGTAGTRGTSTIGIDYKVSPGYIYAPATDYALTITYTLSDL